MFRKIFLQFSPTSSKPNDWHSLIEVKTIPIASNSLNYLHRGYERYLQVSRAKRSRASDPFKIYPSRFSSCFLEIANEISRRSDTINNPSLCVFFFFFFIQSISL